MALQITQLPPAPQRTDAPADFVSKADAHVASLDQFVTETNAVATQLNGFADSAEADAAAAAGSEAAAATSAAAAGASEATSAANANFKGRWSDLTGALNIPAAVSHNGQTWQLLANLADVTLSEPGVTPDWTVINDVIAANVRINLLDNPTMWLFKKNKLVETLEGNLSSTRTTSATKQDRYGSVVTENPDVPREQNSGWLVEGPSTNFMLHSEDFTNAAWIDVGNVSVASNTITAPDGTLSADTITSNTAAFNGKFQGVTIANNEYATNSFFVKSGTVTQIRLRTIIQGGTTAIDESTIFDLSNGTIISGVGGIEALNNGWFRVSRASLNNASGNTQSQGFLLANNVPGDFYAWGAQQERLPLATSYIATTTIPVTRGADDLTCDTYENLPDLTKDWSVVFKLSVSKFGDINGSARRLLNAVDDRFFCQLTGGALQVGNSLTTAVSATLPASTKNDVAVVSLNGTTYIYFNGDLSNSGAVQYETLRTGLIYILQSFSKTLHAYATMADLRWYDFALNSDEIKMLGGS